MADVTIERIRKLMQELAPGREDLLDELSDLYRPDATFEDPIQRIGGLDAIVRMNRRLLAGARELQFTVHDAAEGEGVMFFTWTMRFALKRGPVMSFPGATRLRLRDGKIAEHRDYFDLAGGLLDAVPGLGRIYRRVVAAFG